MRLLQCAERRKFEDVAAKTFVENGCSSTEVKEIAEKAGIPVLSGPNLCVKELKSIMLWFPMYGPFI